MAEAIASRVTERCAIVTGANRGLGFETCKQLAAKGITVVLTARDEKRGVEAIEKLRGFGLSDRVIFHQLEVTDPSSVASLFDFIKTKFGKLDILINNAGIGGLDAEGDAGVAGDASFFVEFVENTISHAHGVVEEEIKSTVNGGIIGTYEVTERCLQINYYAVKRMTEAFIPLLKLSDLPRIVNVSSLFGRLKLFSKDCPASMLRDVENLTEERVDALLNEYLKDFKEGSLEAKKWPFDLSAYKLSKAAVSAYTRITAKNHSTVCVNCLCPGFVRTEMNGNIGHISVEEGAANIVNVALLPEGSPSGLFYDQQKVSYY